MLASIAETSITSPARIPSPMKSVITSRPNNPGTLSPSGIEIEPVKSAAAGHHVAAETADQRVVAEAALQASLPTSPIRESLPEDAEQLVVAVPAVQRVVAEAAVQLVVAVSAVQRVVAAESVQCIRQGVPGQRIAKVRADKVFDADQRIGASTTGVLRSGNCQTYRHPGRRGGIGRRVVAQPAIQRVIAVAAVQDVVAGAAVENVLAIAASQEIVAKATEQGFLAVPPER